MSRIFVSHVREERNAAIALKEQLERALPGATVWVSSIDLTLGQAWLQGLEKELEGAKAMLVLCSSLSVTKPWINFESGFGRGTRLPVVPICHRGLRRDRLPYPLSMFQSCDTSDPNGSPWRSTMSAECIAELVDWVRGGGRMLLLGFELGDRHHGANLGDLARRFGIHPMIDIVGPRHHGPTKPYGVWFDFTPGGTHPLTAGLERIRLCNVQTVMVEPGGREWLHVGGHAIYRPSADHVFYREGTLTQPGGGRFDINNDGGWVPVAVDAPAGLAHSGAVRFLGTWDLLRAADDPPPHETRTLLERLLEWLSGADGS